MSLRGKIPPDERLRRDDSPRAGCRQRLLGERGIRRRNLAMSKTSAVLQEPVAGYSDILIAAEGRLRFRTDEAGFKIEKAPIAVDALVFIVNRG